MPEVSATVAIAGEAELIAVTAIDAGVTPAFVMWTVKPFVDLADKIMYSFSVVLCYSFK